MTSGPELFGGSMPEAYHRGLGLTIFESYAVDLAGRLEIAGGMHVLEVAAGTGVVTRAILDRLPGDGRLTATDISEPMLGVGRAHIGDDLRLEWRPADAQALPFADASFDALVCQFGLMFFPDKPLAMREARRVLRPGGALLLNTWDSLEMNAFARVTNETLVALFPTDPPGFFYTPFGYWDRAVIGALLADAGFTDVLVEHVDKMAVSESSDRFARGMVLGTPILAEIEARGTLEPTAVAAEVASRLAELGGASPHRSPMRAVVASARA